MFGLPGGSSGSGPATTGGIITVVLVTGAAIIALVWFLNQAVPG